jgi:hypothetical protein
MTIGKKDIMASYNQDGMLEYVTDIANDRKMMFEFYQEGLGYEIGKTKGYVVMEKCDASYVRIMELDYFIPKYLFIKNDKG